MPMIHQNGPRFHGAHTSQQAPRTIPTTINTISNMAATLSLAPQPCSDPRQPAAAAGNR